MLFAFCGLKINNMDQCPYGGACLTNLPCQFRKTRNSNCGSTKPKTEKRPKKSHKTNKHKKGKSNQSDKPKQKRNPEKDFKPPKNSRKRKDK